MSPPQLVLATRSHHKAREIARILAPVHLSIRSLADLDVPRSPEEEHIEVYDTFAANALAKARHFAQRLHRVTLADDSGLRVDALDGAPGVHTKRFSGRDDLHGRELDDANNALLLDRLQDVPPERRGARYVCCAAVAWPDGRSLHPIGTVRGRIATTPQGESGFGYDPLFHVPGLDARFAQVHPDVKNAVSHRARAFRALTASLQAAPWALTP
ncbi:MAG: non-canonical purine NTP pyrophosphatase [Gemmatimonadota bacterium]